MSSETPETHEALFQDLVVDVGGPWWLRPSFGSNYMNKAHSDDFETVLDEVRAVLRSDPEMRYVDVYREANARTLAFFIRVESSDPPALKVRSDGSVPL